MFRCTKSLDQDPGVFHGTKILSQALLREKERFGCVFFRRGTPLAGFTGNQNENCNFNNLVEATQLPLASLLVAANGGSPGRTNVSGHVEPVIYP